MKDNNDKWGLWLQPSCIPITIILVLIILIVLLPLLQQKRDARDEQEIKYFLQHWDQCGDKCRFTIVESIPENLTFNGTTFQSVSVFEGWMNLLSIAKETIDIASSYWSLRGDDVWSDPTDWQGEQIFKELLRAGTERKITIRIAQNQPSIYQPNNDTEELQNRGAAMVRSLDFQKLVGSGILHTKMWLIDNKHFYLGSANLDWRSLTQVKELGVIIYNCSCLAEDMAKIFQIYWYLGLPTSVIPPQWPPEFATEYNNTSPLNIKLNETNSTIYLASSPAELCAKNRLPDVDAILDVIDKAVKFIYVAVMDYSPTTLYTRDPMYWPVIDDRLRAAAMERNVKIRILGSYWNQTKPSMPYFLNSLSALNSSYTSISLEVKLFEVPIFNKEQALIPFARVNHNKYMVTDNAAYIGTSNWSGDYFISTGGIGLVVNQTASDSPNATQPIRQTIQAIFERDWNSEYAHPLSKYIHKENLAQEKTVKNIR